MLQYTVLKPLLNINHCIHTPLRTRRPGRMIQKTRITPVRTPQHRPHQRIPPLPYALIRVINALFHLIARTT